ncbi:hypothetical protein [Occallatibacter riparius]|uniref:Uncharacterized protein n=1 Tax=Occallatibacter riparius TaxID=1002689 RepID=A0A9J7BHV6_9BACT|nr:hypothetical protein [Occallatibacter riparius]UWZ82524.1 hypothetical protein MOP44_18330 [Occallatibacter riparius]
MFEHTSPGSNRRFAASLLNARRAFGSPEVLALAAFLVLPAAAQSPVMPSGPSGPSPNHFGHRQQPQPESEIGMDGRIEARRIVQLNLLRQKSIISDSEKLLRLAQELDNDAKAGASALSPAERMRKAAEIERLAKEVKEKMTYSIGDPPQPATPFAIYTR